MVAGTARAVVIFGGVEPWQAALVGVILAPTDAALGQAVVANPRVPAVIRNALNVESGLNDGLALPFVTILVTVGLVAGGAETELHAAEILLLALGGSTLIGLLAGLGGGWLLRLSAERGLAAERRQAIALLALAVGTFVAADQVEASGFLAVWVAGLATGTMVRGHVAEDAFHLSEQTAKVLAAIGFLLLGAGLLGPGPRAGDPGDGRLRRAQPDGRADRPRRHRDAADRVRPCHPPLRRLVRAARPRLDRLRGCRRRGRPSRRRSPSPTSCSSPSPSASSSTA